MITIRGKVNKTFGTMSIVKDNKKKRLQPAYLRRPHTFVVCVYT